MLSDDESWRGSQDERVGSDLALVTWPGATRATERAAEEAYAAIDALLRARGCGADPGAGLRRPAGGARASPGAARARWADAAGGRCRRPTSRARRSARTGWPASTSSAARRSVAPGGATATACSAASSSATSARLLGLADVGRRAAGPARRGTGRGDGGDDRRRGGSARARGLLLPRRGADLVLPAGHPRLVRAVQRGAQRRLPADGAHGPERGRAIPASTGIEGRNARGGLVHARPHRRRRPGAAPVRDGAAPQPASRTRRRSTARPSPGGWRSPSATPLLFVSGTASIDDHGATVHVGDFETQARYTLAAVSALLEAPGRGLPDVRQATAFLEEPLRPALLRADRRPVGLSGVPDGHHRGRRLPRRPAVRDRRHRRRPAPAGRGGGDERRSRVARALLAALGCVAACRSRSRRRRARPIAPIVVAQVPVAGPVPAALAGGTLRARLGEGGRLVVVSPGGKPRGPDRVASTARPTPRSPSTGQSIVFAGRKEAGDPWCVWEMRADGTAARKVTCGPGGRPPAGLPAHDVHPHADARRSPGSRSPSWGRSRASGTRPGSGPHTRLWSCKRTGPALRRLTFNLSSDFDPVLLPDGRMIFASWQRHSPGPRADGRVALFGVNIDGTDLMIFAGDEGRRVKHMPAATGDRPRGLRRGGRGSRATAAGRLASVSLRRNLHSYRSITGRADGLYHSPSTHPDGGVLVVVAPGRRLGDLRRLPPRPRDRRPGGGLRRPGVARRAGQARRPAAGARRALEHRPRGRPRGQALRPRRGHQRPRRRRFRRAAAKRLRVVEGPRRRPGRSRSRRGASSARSTSPTTARSRSQVPANTPSSCSCSTRTASRCAAAAGSGCASTAAGLHRLPRGPRADAPQPLGRGAAGAGGPARPAPGAAPRRRASPRDVRPIVETTVPVLPRRGRERPAPRRGRAGAALAASGRTGPGEARTQPARVAPARAGDRRGRGTRRGGDRGREARCRPGARRSPPTRSGPSSSGSTSGPERRASRAPAALAGGGPR